MWVVAKEMECESWYEPRQYIYSYSKDSELGKLGMRVLSQVISAKHSHVQTDVSNRLSPERTRKAVYVYSNTKVLGKSKSLDFKPKLYEMG